MPPRGGKSYRQGIVFKKAIRERDNHTCQTCGKRLGDNGVRQLDIAHVIPYSTCHKTTPDNVRVLCHSCNLKESENGNGTAAHLNGPDGAVLRAWDRKADPHGTMDPTERRERALELQREHLVNAGRNSWKSRRAQISDDTLDRYKSMFAPYVSGEDRDAMIRIFANIGPELTLTHLAYIFGLSRGRVHQILKRQLREPCLNPADTVSLTDPG